MDWLACDCVQLFVSLLFVPRRVGETVIFLCSNFLDASMGLLLWVCGGLFFWLGLGFSRPFQCCAEILFVESLILAQDERWRRA